MTGQALAIDIGGTKVACAVVDTDGTVLQQRTVPTPRVGDPEAVFAPVASTLVHLLSGWQGDLRIGIASAGPVDVPHGKISPVNIGAWDGYPIVERVRQVAARSIGGEPSQISLVGDGHAVALGEYWRGAGQGLDSMIGMVLSTGVGGGAVINHKLFTGGTGNAVHIGHTSIDINGELCVCGNVGCVESYARGPALVEAAQRHGLEVTDARALTDLARAGDPVAVGVIDHGMRALAQGMVTAAAYLDVRVIVLGGGVAKAGEVIFAPIRRHLAAFAVLPYVRGLELRPAVLDNAGLLGAAALGLGEVSSQ